MRFIVPDELPPGKPNNVTVTHLAFTQEEGDLPWIAILFCHEDAALVRGFVHLRRSIGDDEVGALMTMINWFNYHHLLDAHLEYVSASSTVRIRATFRATGIGLPAVELRDWLDVLFLRGDYFTRIFKQVNLRATDLKTELESARERVRVSLGLQSHPVIG